MMRDASDSGGWCAIDCDPDVLTDMIVHMGVKGIQVEELWSLESEVEELRPVYGLVFMYSWQPNEVEDSRPLSTWDKDLYFANQVVNNAFATQAILCVLMNCTSTVDLGPELKALHEITRDCPPDIKGLSISNSEIIRKTHNVFARHDQLGFDQRFRPSDKDFYHFVSYVPVNNRLYELDGLKKGPVFLGDCDETNWLNLIRPYIQRRIDKYDNPEMHFYLMAVCASRVAQFQKSIEASQIEIQELTSRLASLSASATKSRVAEEAVLHARIVEASNRVDSASASLEEELENMLRKHNHTPFIVKMLKLLSQKRELGGFTFEAKRVSDIC